MRRTMTAVLLGAGLALAVTAGPPASAQTVSVSPVQQAPADPHSSHGSQLKASSANEDTAMRSMYVAMGAMTGYMFAVMPVTMTAITAAAASGVVSMWVYDTMIGPSAPAH